MKINCAKLDGNVQFAIAAKVDAMRWQCYDCWANFTNLKEAEVFLLKKWSLTDWVFSDSCISVGCFRPLSV